MSAVVHVLKTARATFWTGPQVFQTVHYMACREKIRRMYRTVQNSAVQCSTVQTWNMACREKIRRMYHRRPYTATSTSLPILATCNSYSLV